MSTASSASFARCRTSLRPRAFYTEFGLQETSSGTFATQIGGEQLVLRTGDEPRVAELNIETDAEADLDAIARRIEDLVFPPRAPA
ncbi:hypothetical protein [Amycolatopsis sp. H20-H5]|uniref:hypothetical protein n=1 Tax=Amycolatopsis sp. H20-H5 TaxID=3046309 RepID=UPI002DBD86F8|nr:hypothetical protein [Amycolatopsis sp. H20-H5]MEC3975769.1 hypothetical protein [Amycolatopsis sp. H20-H5]